MGIVTGHRGRPASFPNATAEWRLAPPLGGQAAVGSRRDDGGDPGGVHAAGGEGEDAVGDELGDLGWADAEQSAGVGDAHDGAHTGDGAGAVAGRTAPRLVAVGTASVTVRPVGSVRCDGDTVEGAGGSGRETLSLPALVDEVAATLAAAPAAAPDGRVGAVPDARTVRFYQSLGLVSPPLRSGGRAWYTQRHVRQVVAVKRAQAAGQRLASLPTPVDAGVTDAPAQLGLFEVAPVAPADGELPGVADPSVAPAWTLRLPGAVLVVTGVLPPPEDARRLRDAAAPLAAALAALRPPPPTG